MAKLSFTDSLAWLALLHGVSTLAQAQTRPLVNPEELARAQSDQAAQQLSASRAWRFEPSIGATVTATDNSGFSYSSDKERDVIVDIEPRFIVRGRGASFTLDGNVGAKALIYTHSTQENRLLPSGTIMKEDMPRK